MKILMLGGTGTIGSAATEELVRRGHAVTAASRDDTKLALLAERLCGVDTRICDVTYVDDLFDIFSDKWDFVVNAAALKHVVYCERFPLAAFRVNSVAAHSVASFCAHARIPYLFISTDKAVQPVSVLGRSKMRGEEATRSYGGHVVRFGNVLGSRGSVLPIWQEQLERRGKLRLTSVDMVRWWIALKDAASFIANVVENPGPNPLHVPGPDVMFEMPVLKVMQLAFGPEVPYEIVKPGTGEKLHEELYWPHERPEGAAPAGA